MCKIYVVNHTNRRHYASMLEEMHLQRYQKYSLERGWSKLSNPLGMDIDEYDNSLTTWLLAVSDEGELLGAIRLMPSDCRTLLSDHFSFLCTNMEVPDDPKVWEITRYYMMEKECVAADGHDVKRHLIIGMLEYALMEAVKGMIVVMDTGFLRMMEAFKWNYKPMGMPQRYEEGQCVAVYIALDQEMVERHRSMTNFWSHNLVLPGQEVLTCEKSNFLAEETRVLIQFATQNAAMVSSMAKCLRKLENSDEESSTEAMQSLQTLVLQNISAPSSYQSNVPATETRVVMSEFGHS